MIAADAGSVQRADEMKNAFAVWAFIDQVSSENEVIVSLVEGDVLEE